MGPCYLPSYLLTQASLQILSKLSFLSPSCLFVADGSPILILLGSLLVPPHVATTFWFLLGWFPFVCPSHPIWLNVVQLCVYQHSSACWSRCDAWVTSLVAARQRVGMIGRKQSMQRSQMQWSEFMVDNKPTYICSANPLTILHEITS